MHSGITLGAIIEAAANDADPFDPNAIEGERHTPLVVAEQASAADCCLVLASAAGCGVGFLLGSRRQGGPALKNLGGPGCTSIVDHQVPQPARVRAGKLRESFTCRSAPQTCRREFGTADE